MTHSKNTISPTTTREMTDEEIQCLAISSYLHLLIYPAAVLGSWLQEGRPSQTSAAAAGADKTWNNLGNIKGA